MDNQVHYFKVTWPRSKNGTYQIFKFINGQYWYTFPDPTFDNGWHHGKNKTIYSLEELKCIIIKNGFNIENITERELFIMML